MKSKSYGKESAIIVTAAYMTYVGTILHFGGYYQRRPIQSLWYRIGRSS